MKNEFDEEKFAPRIMMQRNVTEGKPLPVWIDYSDRIYAIERNPRDSKKRT